MLYHWHGVAIPVPKLLVPPSARSAQGGTRQQTTARRHRGLLPIGSAQQQAVLLASTSQLHHLQALCGCVSSPPSAEHRSSLSGRGPLTERPSTRISHGRTMPASGSAGPGRWPASHVPTMACSRDLFFRKRFPILYSYGRKGKRQKPTRKQREKGRGPEKTRNTLQCRIIRTSLRRGLVAPLLRAPRAFCVTCMHDI